MMTPNRRLRQARELRGWSQAKVAEQIGTDATTVSRWERGLFSPTPYFRERLCELFGKNTEELGLLETSEQPPLEQEYRQQTEGLYPADVVPLTPPSWPKRTDTFTYILQSAAYDELAHTLWENAYVRMLQGQLTQAQELGEASMNAFAQVGHSNAAAIREWLSHRGLATAQAPTTGPLAPQTAATGILAAQPTPSGSLSSHHNTDKSRRIGKRSVRRKRIGFLLMLLLLPALVLFGLSFNLLRPAPLSSVPHVRPNYNGAMSLTSLTPVSHGKAPATATPRATKSFARTKPFTIAAGSPTGAPSATAGGSSGIMWQVSPGHLTPQNCKQDTNSYRCTIEIQIFIPGQSSFNWSATSQKVAVKFNPTGANAAVGQPFQIIAYVYSSPGQSGLLIFTCNAAGSMSSKYMVYWQG